MIVKKATLNDIDAIVDFYKRTAEYEKSLNDSIGAGHFDEENFRADIAREILLSEFYYAFAVENDEFVGFLSWYLKEKNNWWTYNQIAYIDHLFVEEKSRGKGIARILMADFEAWANKNGADLVIIEVIPENQNAENIYRHLWYENHMICLHKTLWIK